MRSARRYSPAPIVELILVQFSKGRATNALAFVAARNRLIMGIICTLMGLLLVAKGMGAIA